MAADSDIERLLQVKLDKCHDRRAVSRDEAAELRAQVDRRGAVAKAPAARSATPQPPDGKGWLPEVKHDGHRLASMIATAPSN